MCESPWEVMPGVASFPGWGVPQVHHFARTLGCRLQATCRVMSTCWSETTFRGKVISLSFKASQAFMNVLPLWWIRSNSAKVRHLSLSSAAPCSLAWPCAIWLYWGSCYQQCVNWSTCTSRYLGHRRVHCCSFLFWTFFAFRELTCIIILVVGPLCLTRVRVLR